MNEHISKRRKLLSSLERHIEPITISEDEVEARNSKEKTEKTIPSICQRKTTYFEFIVDQSFTMIQIQEEEIRLHLMKCLRYRLPLQLDLKKNGIGSSIDDDCFEFESFLDDSGVGSSFISENHEDMCKKGTYDSLLQLIDEFDAAGMAEIFRLLLERRIAIPLFQPDSKKHHLNILRHITLPGVDGIRLGEDKTLLRVAVISCRKPNQSQTAEIIKSLFNSESIYSYDVTSGSVTSKFSMAEIGRGCFLMDVPGPEKVKQLLVVHFIGDFKPLLPFVRHFADFLIIEDSTLEEESSVPFIVEEIQKRANSVRSNPFPFICVWKPSVGQTRCTKSAIDEFYQFNIDGQLTGILLLLRKIFRMAIEKFKAQPQFCKEERLSLYQIPILVNEGFIALECVSPVEIECQISQSVGNFVQVKKKDFVLQKNFRQEAKHEEAKLEHRMNEEKLRKEDAKIQKCRNLRRVEAFGVQKHPLISLFLNLLANEDASTRVLSVRVLEKVLGERSKLELGPQMLKVRELHTSYVELQATNQKPSKDFNKNGELDLAKDKLNSAKIELIDGVLNIEHLWREMSHLYTAVDPGSRSSTIKNIPRLAAQHLLDGFCLELLDGDSNMMNLEWVKEVLRELVVVGRFKWERIFVLSVMGVQSSGKSTLLNTMFGVQMRTSVGQCTRGVNMQLLAVEGRPEYDYILLLDTEGTRSPEHHGLPGSEKRDNQMATLIILLADATIVVTPGKNDAAIKEILPIVLMAYQGSKLAEENGDRLSSRMFFVYNRIDTSQKDKLDNIIQTLGTSLHEAFNQVQKMTGNNSYNKTGSPFGNFNLDTSNSTGSDVCILGNVRKEFEPPGDVPDPAFGESLIKLREHIHRRVTNAGDGSIWRSRSIEEFSSYLDEVWRCIRSADFTFNFASIVERITFDKLDFEFKIMERKLAGAYQDSFEKITKLMIEVKSGSIGSSSTEGNDERQILSFEAKLRDRISAIEQTLDTEVKTIIKGKGRDKWSLQFQQLWESTKKDQARNWTFNLRTSFTTLFSYEHHVESYKKKMRIEINKLFKSATFVAQEWTEVKKNEKFEEMFDQILVVVKQKFPLKDVAAEILKVYQNSNVILTRQIEINQSEDLDSKSSFLSHVRTQFSNFLMGKNFRQNVIDSCSEKISSIVNRIAGEKLCYDDVVISNVICEVDAAITEHNISLNSEVQLMHLYGQGLIIDLMQKIEKNWEEENSVFAKLQQVKNKEAMRQYFMMVSTGVEKTKLFAATLTSALEAIVLPAFEKEMAKRTSSRIRNERWLHDARFLHKHMDLYLIYLIEKKNIPDLLRCISNPQRLYDIVLRRLIAAKVPSVNEERQTFMNHLKEAIKNAALATATLNADKGRAQTFVDQLRAEFLNGYLQSEDLASAFLIDCTGEYEDCDSEDKTEFQEICLANLMQMLEDKSSPNNQQEFARKLSLQVVKYMKSLNDHAALPRCNAICPICNSLCIEAANHDTKLRAHDAIHQPAGIAGTTRRLSRCLFHTTCSQDYKNNGIFYLSITGEPHNYRDFEKVFPGWKNPRMNEELPLREYILATYNEDIAKMYNVKPCNDIPATYFRDLATIKQQLKREIDK